MMKKEEEETETKPETKYVNPKTDYITYANYTKLRFQMLFGL